MDSADDHHELADSLRTHAVATKPDPDADGDELARFDPAVEGVDVVGLGEATHRTRELVRVRHRLVRHLVREHGFRAFALEAPFSETMALHDHVVHGEGDLGRALERTGFTIHQTEETAALFRWLREFNRDRPESDRIAVYGFDVQSAGGGAAALLAFFEGLDASDRPDEGSIRTLETLSNGVFEGEDVDEGRLRAAERVVPELADWFERRADGDHAVPRRHLRTLEQACEFARTGMEADRPEQWGLRDRFMAENVAWIRDRAGPSAVWAHNNHVKTGKLSGDGYPSATMGEHLSRRFGRGYYALGTQFGEGTVRALVPAGADGTGDGGETFEFDGQRWTRATVPVPDPVDGSVPELFAAAGESALLVDYRSLPDGDPLRAWLSDPRPHHYVAGSVEPGDPGSFYRDHVGVEEFDGLAYVASATPTTRL